MKTRTKVLILALSAILLVVTTVFATLAFLTSQDSVVNTFTVGNVAITMDEKDVDNDGDAADNVTIDEVVRDKANAYKLMPGKVYEKDPTIRVDANSEDCFIFVKVENGIAAIEGGTTIAQQMAAKGWVSVAGADGVYCYYGVTDGTPNASKKVVSAGANIVVFENFTISNTVNNATLNTYSSQTITVTAYAVQAEGFTESEPAAIVTAAFPTLMNP